MLKSNFTSDKIGETDSDLFLVYGSTSEPTSSGHDNIW